MIHVYTYHSERAVALCVADEFEPIEATEGAMHLLNRVRAAELELRRSDAEPRAILHYRVCGEE